MPPIPPSSVACPKCKQPTEIIDEQTYYRNEVNPVTHAIDRVPTLTIYAHRCRDPKCRHLFTRSVKH